MPLLLAHVQVVVLVLVARDLRQDHLRGPQVAGCQARLLDVRLGPPGAGQDGFDELLVEGISHGCHASGDGMGGSGGGVDGRGADRGHGSGTHEHGGLLDLAIDGAPRFEVLALEIEEPGDGVALAPALGREELRADPVGALVEPDPLEAEQAAVDGVG